MENSKKITCDPELLRKWYVDEMRSYRWIMNKLGVNANRGIKRLLIENNIDIRRGSEAVKAQWIGNETRRIKTSNQAKKSLRPYWGKMSKLPWVAKKISESKMGNKNPMWGKFGSKNPGYLGGKLSRKIPKKTRKLAFDRARNKCEKCSSTKNLTIHHEPPYRVCKSHDLKFLQVLCHDCHFCRPQHLK